MSKRSGLKEKLHISSIDENCAAAARAHGLGVEIAEFCWAYYIDNERDAHIENCRRMMAESGSSSFWFHAPFAELAACAIDPRARELAMTRYLQSAEIARELGIDRLVIHGGYIPYVYYPVTYVDQSIAFWNEFLEKTPEELVVALENVMEPSPEMLVQIADGVDSPRLGLCLDIGHANCIVSKTPPLDWVKPMAKRLFHVHIHDNIGENDLHLPLGEGSIPVESILDAVLELCPTASFTIENMYSAGSIEWLVKKGYIQKP
ncbi:MAG: sugar phosphate isomerase/epimerase [Clostridia bacterium]|nr:sugar phosphate isomerase/epimerase [Clostridia bacterium]